MDVNFEKALAVILHHEGLWSDHRDDPGGATMKGVTLRTFSEFLGRPATKEELRGITDEQLGKIYRKRYWDVVACPRLPSGLDLVVFDMAVNSGPGRAVRILQETLGVTADGSVGPKTLVAIGDHDLVDLIGAYSEGRNSFYRNLPIYATFGKGWLRRVEEVKAEALKLVGDKS